MAYVNVAEWSPEHVADWLRGLDDEIQPYTQFFINNNINGCHLLTLCRDDLANLNICKIGHQELVLDAVELLRQLHYNLTSETLQSLALKLGCKARSLFNHLKHVGQDYIDSGKKERVSTETLSSVSDILNLVKSLISWLDRYPFLGQDKYVDVRKAVLKHSVELASTAQRDQFAETPHEVIKEICLNLAIQSDKIVQEFNDSLIIQPAVLEVAKVKRKLDDDLGIHINSSYTGIHIIEDVKFQSPAYRCGKIEDGDEIVQVNYQTVVGWQVKNIICAMREHPNEVHVTLKKRPRHPNVLGQVITLWPYRIPSKKTAFRKLYKWSKGKSTVDIRDICPKSPDPRGEINNVTESCVVPNNEKERQFLVGRSRSRIRRRATVTGVSPTALQPPISLEELIGSNMKKKHSVGRTVSYDPGKMVDVEDSIFKDEPQNLGASAMGGNSEHDKSNSSNGEEKKVITSKKSNFLQPPPDFHLSGNVKKQKERAQSVHSPKSNMLDSKLLIDFSDTNVEVKQPVSPMMKTSDNSAATSFLPRDCTKSQENPKQKLVDWVQKQKQKEATINGNNAPQERVCNQTPSSGSNLPLGGRDSSLHGPRKNSSNTSKFPTREGRPSLSEIRAMKRTTESRAGVDRFDAQVDKNIPAIQRQQYINKGNVHLQNRLGNNCAKSRKTQENELSQKMHAVQGFKPTSKIPENYRRPNFMNYATVPEFPYEMHESKIISLKPKIKTSSFPEPRNKLRYVSKQATNSKSNGVQFHPSHRTSKPSSPHTNTLLRSAQDYKKVAYPSAFYSPSGRSLSFNNIAFSSDDSSSEEYEVYEEINDPSPRQSMNKPYSNPNSQCSYNQINPRFAAKVTEVYNMLNQGHCFSVPPNKHYESQFDPESTAMIDELARRMYHALQVNHFQTQNSVVSNGSFIPPTDDHVTNNPKQSNKPFQQHGKNIPNEAIYSGQCAQTSDYGYPLYQCYTDNSDFNVAHEQQANLSPSASLHNRHTNQGFKSATSQEIHNLYTTQGHGKTQNGVGCHQKYNCDKEYCSELTQQSECFEKDHIYESLPLQENKPKYELDKEKNYIRIGKCNESIMVCPAERESESELPVKEDGQIQRNDKAISAPSDGWRYFDKGLFRPIKDDCSIDEQCNDRCHNSYQTVPSKDSYTNGNKEPNCLSSNGKVDFSLRSDKKTKFLSYNSNENSTNNVRTERYSDSNLKEITKPSNRNAQLSITSLMSNIPKPPDHDCCSAITKCSAAQTESEVGNVHNVEITIDDPTHETESHNISSSLGNDDSFISSLNATHNIENTNHNSSSSSSLNSSASNSTISSTGSCYYYVETRIRPHLTMKPLSVISDNNIDLSLLDALRSPPLPTMGVSMLSKKRTPSNSSSDPGNVSSTQQPILVPVSTAEQIPEVSRLTGIITDVEHTI